MKIANIGVLSSLLLASSVHADAVTIKNEFEPGKEASANLAALIDVCKEDLKNASAEIFAHFGEANKMAFCTCTEDAILTDRANDNFADVGRYCTHIAHITPEVVNQYRIEGKLAAIDIYNQMAAMRLKLVGDSNDVEAFASCLVDFMRVDNTTRVNVHMCAQRLPEVFKRIKVKGK